MRPLRALVLPTVFGLWTGCAMMSSDSGGGSQVGNALTVQVNSAPPADKTEERAPAPGFGYIWVAGYWDSIDGNFVWRAGRWVQGKPDFEYVRARYEQNGGSWTFHRPHWKRRQKAAAAVATPAPASTSAAPTAQ